MRYSGVDLSTSAIGIYLGTPVLVHADLGGGWVDAQFPDREDPGRDHGKQKPFTFAGRGPDTWRGRMWKNQIGFTYVLPWSVVEEVHLP